MNRVDTVESARAFGCIKTVYEQNRVCERPEFPRVEMTLRIHGCEFQNETKSIKHPHTKQHERFPDGKQGPVNEFHHENVFQ